MKIVIIFILFLCSGTAAQEISRERIKTAYSINLSDRIPEGSGMVFWNGKLWIQNDSGAATLFAVDPKSATIANEYHIPNVKNNDWEELAQDSTYFYIGDFGNNFSRRDTLQIIRIDKQSLLDRNPKTEIIRFAWESKDNPDCEAMIVVSDTIFLFTKEWRRDRRTRMFSLPAIPGVHTAIYRDSFKTKVAVTGASFDGHKLVLCGYNRWIKPHLLEFTAFEGTDFFKANIRKIKVRKCFTQVEGIAADAENYYLVSERFKFMFVRTGQKLHLVKP